MKNLILFACIGLFFYSCSKEVSNGPTIEFNNLELWQDTIWEDQFVDVSISAQSLDAPIEEVEILIDDLSVYDTVFANSDSISFMYPISFFANKGTHTVTIKTTDSNGLIALQRKDIYVLLLEQPNIVFNQSYVYKDTTTSLGSNLDFLIECTKGQRDLDSLFVYYNDVVLYTYPNPMYRIMDDSLQLVPFTFICDSVGEFLLQFKLIDKASKNRVVTKKIIVSNNEN